MSEQHNGAEFIKSQTLGLIEPNGSPATAIAAEGSTEKNQGLIREIEPFQDWRKVVEQVKAYSLANLDKLLVQFEEKLTAKGVTVLWARDAAEANQHVIDIAKRHEVKTVVKAKSMVSEEMELNQALASAGVDSLETDLGEYIVQLAGQRPTHIVTPALHLSAEEIGQLFAEKLNEPYSAEHQYLTGLARKHLREKFIQADMGVSGVNFGIAETGSFCLIENEGNIGLSTTAPQVHVALMGIEKLIPKVDYLPFFLNTVPRSGTGQKLTSYAHLFHGPTPGRTMYLIIIDNGRTNVLKDPEARSALQCVRCGACLNACPVYRQVGGWAYGWVYPGPIGSVITPLMMGLPKAAKLPYASSLCGACSEVCPARIPLPHILVHLRHRATEEPSSTRSLAERIVWRAWAWGMGGPRRYRLTMTSVKIGSRMAKFLPWHPWMLGGWTRGREIPKPPKGPSFRDWHRKNKK